MSLGKVIAIANQLDGLYKTKQAFEADLLRETNAFLKEHQRGSLRDLATRLGISVQYLCDIKYGRRKISRQLIDKLRRLK